MKIDIILFFFRNVLCPNKFVRAATAENVIVLVRIDMSRAEANFIKCVCLRTRHITPDQLCDWYCRYEDSLPKKMHADAISAIGLKNK